MRQVLLDGELVEPSSSLVLGRTQSGDCYAYHSLFGNFAWLDVELHAYLESVPSKLPVSDLVRDVGEESADVLFKSYFFVHDSHEERKLIGSWLSDRQSQLSTGCYLSGLQLSVSNGCNFRCSYCFADAADGRSKTRQRIAADSAHMSFELAERAIVEVLELSHLHGRDRISVKFMGREPLINWGVIRRLLARFPDGTVSWSMTTNGSLINTEIANEMRKHDVAVTVSLDGPPVVNDRVRLPKAGSPGAYEAATDGLRELSNAACPFSVSTVISMATDFGRMDEFISELAAAGARQLELTLAMQTATWHPQAIQGSPDQLITDLIRLYLYARKRGLSVHGDWIDPFHGILATHKFRDELSLARPISPGCSATFHQLSVEPSGDVFPCRAMSLHYGHIEQLNSILKSDNFRKVLMRTYYNVPHCHACDLEGFCQGTCLGSLESVSGDLYIPDERYCAVYRAASKSLLAHLTVRTSRERRPCAEVAE